MSKRYPKVKTELIEQPKAAAKKAPKGDEEAKQKAKEAARMAAGDARAVRAVGAARSAAAHRAQAQG